MSYFHEMTLGAEHVCEKYHGPLGVAEAVLEGRMDSYDQQFVWEICPKNSPMWEAAKIRLEIKLKLRMVQVDVREAGIMESPQLLAKKAKLLP